MKIENNWKSKNLENLEKDYWVKPIEGSSTITRCYELRKIAINQFSIEDLRIMIGQRIGLKYLIPLAIEELKNNILAGGDLFEGDLLEAVKRIDSEYWIVSPEYRNQINSLITHNVQILENKGLSKNLIN